MASPLDADLDHLYQLPPGEFTAARNALAKKAGREGAAIKRLSRPPVAAWAVNQLYWHDRPRYDALVAAATELRDAHSAVIGGGHGDLRSAGKAHEAALDAALKSTLSIMKQQGQPVSDAARQAILNTLRALPSEDPPGRLGRTLSPGGFELLAGIAVAPRSARTRRAAAKGAKPTAGREKKDARTERAAEKAREEREALQRSIREADQRARHSEFEAARTARAALKAEQRLDAARQAMEAAQRELQAADEEATAARQAQRSAEREARTARAALQKLERRRH